MFKEKNISYDPGEDSSSQIRKTKKKVRSDNNQEWKKRVEEEFGKPFSIWEIRGLISIIERKVKDKSSSALDAVNYLKVKLEEIEEDEKRMFSSEVEKAQEKLENLKQEAVLIFAKNIFNKMKKNLAEKGDSLEFRKIYFKAKDFLRDYRQFLPEEEIKEFEESLKIITDKLIKK